jgi:uncharacterized protein (DUF1800 family)
MSVSLDDLGPRAAVFLLNRLGFGPRPGQAARILNQGLQAWVEEQLAAPADPQLEARLGHLPTLNYPISQVLALYNADQRTTAVILDEFASAKVIRMVHAQNQLQEVLVDFWFNHFNVFIGDDFTRQSAPAYERDAIRPHALGHFRDLLGATAQHPAMLFYLDNYLSTAPRVVGGRSIGLNENYGRELLELHTVGVTAGYTQQDVIASARCFTGWGIDSLRTSGTFVYRAGAHDTGAKSVFGLNLPAGGGQDDGAKLLDYLTSHPATAHHVSSRLVQRFVADDPPASLVERCAETFLHTHGDIQATLRTLVSSAEFWAEAFGAGKLKTPLEFAASALRAADAQVSHGRGVGSFLTQMGMPLYGCVPPTGYTNRGVDWINPSSQLSRMNFALDLAQGAVPGVAVDARSVVRSAGGSSEDPHSAATALSADLFGRGLSAETLSAAARVSPGGAVSVASRVLGLCLASPEMQAR